MDQYGSACDRVENEIENHVFLANLEFRPTEKITLGLDASLTLAEEEMDSFHPAFPSGVWTYDQASNSFHISYLSSDGSTVDMTGFTDYSDLDYTIFNLTFTANFEISDSVSVYGVFNYTDFTDDEEYVYGDLDGEFYSANVGINYKF